MKILKFSCLLVLNSIYQPSYLSSSPDNNHRFGIDHVSAQHGSHKKPQDSEPKVIGAESAGIPTEIQLGHSEPHYLYKITSVNKDYDDNTEPRKSFSVQTNKLIAEESPRSLITRRPLHINHERRATLNQTKSTNNLAHSLQAAQIKDNHTEPSSVKSIPAAAQSSINNHSISVAKPNTNPTALPSVESNDGQDHPKSLAETISNLYKSSYQYYGLVIALTFAAGIGLLLMIISIIKCICQSPKFANPKDYPNGFPWEVRASRILTGNGRINSGGRRSQLSPLDTGMGRPNPSAKRDWSKFKNQRTLAPSPIRTSLQGYRSAPLTPSPQYERKDYSFDGQTSTVELYYMNSSNNNEMSKKWEESPAYLSSRAPSSSTPSATDDGSCESHRDELDTPPLQPALMRGISLKDEYFKNVQRVSFHDLEYNRGAQIEKQ